MADELKRFDVQATMVGNAVVMANSEEEAEQIVRDLLETYSIKNDCLSGDSFDEPAVTEFSVFFNRGDVIDIDEAGDI